MLSESQRAALAARLRRDREGNPGRDREASQAGRITRRPADVRHPPASFGQEQLWFLDRLAPGRAAYNLPCPVHIRGPLELPALDRALTALLDRHEALRTRLADSGQGHPVQIIDPPRATVAELRDYSGAGPDQARQRLAQLSAEEVARPFDLAAGPLLRAHLVRLAAEEHVLLITVHHAVFDGMSAGVLLHDLAALYAAQATGNPASLAELPVRFGDYAWWERQRLQGNGLAELEAYWRGVMDGFENLRLPTDRPRPSVHEVDGAEETRALPMDLLDGLNELSRREGSTLFATLLAALAVLLHHYTGQADLVVGTTSANRSRAALADMIAFLVNTLPIRADLSGDPSFTDLVARVKQATIGAYAHQELPFAKIVETLRVQRDASRPPVIQFMFNLVNAQDAAIPAAQASFRLAGKLSDAGRSRFDISLFANAGESEFTIQAIYATALFDRTTIQRLLGHLEVVLRGVVADPSARVSQLPVLTDTELRQELTGWNDTAREFPVTCLHQGFEAQAARTPDGVAAQLGAERVSYAELNQRANQVARRLRVAGVGPEVLVGVCMRASPARLAALLGILKAGGGYVPLDPALPPERMSFMMSDAGLTVVLADDSTRARLPDTGAAVLSMDAEQATLNQLASTDLSDAGVTPANVAYVIYTSGSTGQPKGVVVEHRQAANFAHGMIHHWRIGPDDAVLQFASLSFDVSVMDMFVPLLAGGRVVLVPPDTLRSPPRLAALITGAGVTYACLTPAVLSLLAGYDLPGLRSLVSGGEELPSELVRAWLRPGLDFYNTYGPTEAAVVTTFIHLDAGTKLPPPIGRPLPNYQAYVLDSQLSPVPAGVTGELHIGGAGVARGYLNRPGLTASRFIPDPFSPDPGARLYKSGDLVRRRDDGTIVFVGRADGQVKVRGLRIELGEIEAALLACPGVAQAAVTVVTDPAGEKQLAGYLRAGPGPGPSPEELRAQLARTLPSYMIPAHVITVEAFPLNPSGKIDRAALPAPGQDQAAARANGYVAPASFLETVLTGLYATVLNAGQIGATDSFFDVGGSSLQVMRLVGLISKELGADVGVAAIFQHPTPRQLAGCIEAIRSGLRQSGASGPLVELTNGVGELPLFLIHAVGGTVFAYAQLASELAGTFRVYGMEAPGLSAGHTTAPSLADLAGDYLRRIQEVQPAGPYRLAGWSMGGVIAFEVAQRLERAGHQVDALILLDAPFDMPESDLPALPHLAARFLADATGSLGWDPDGLPDPAAASADEQLGWLAGRLTSDSADQGSASSADQDSAGQAGAEAVAVQLHRRFGVFQAHVRMLAGYQPQRPAVSAPTMIVTADDSPNAPARAHWPQVLSGPVTTQPVPGDHYNFLRLPLVAEVAASILKWQDGSA